MSTRPVVAIMTEAIMEMMTAQSKRFVLLGLCARPCDWKCVCGEWFWFWYWGWDWYWSWLGWFGDGSAVGYVFAYGYWPSVTVVVVTCSTVWTDCCTRAPAGIVSPVVVMRLPPWLAYMETEIWTESPGEVGDALKPSCPLN
jgi:hypothetical protein